MIYGKMPMMIFLLASGYLLTVYLLLALAKRTGKKDNTTNTPTDKRHRQQETPVPKITQATSLR